MSLDSIKNKIIDDAKIKVQSIEQEAHKEANDILNRAKNEAIEQKRIIVDNAKKEADMKTNRILASAELEGRKHELAAMQDTVEKCFNLAVDKLANLPDKEYKELIDKMVKSVPDSDKMEFIEIPKQQKGGFLLKKGDVTLNFSFEALAKNEKEKMHKQVVKILGW